MKSLAAGLVYLWLVSLPVLSHVRARVWQDETALWVGAAQWAPQKLRPRVQIGQYEQAIRIWAEGHRPAFERVGCQIAVENLARVLDQQGQYAAALKWSSYRCDGPLSW